MMFGFLPFSNVAPCDCVAQHASVGRLAMQVVLHAAIVDFFLQLPIRMQKPEYSLCLIPCHFFHKLRPCLEATQV